MCSQVWFLYACGHRAFTVFGCQNHTMDPQDELALSASNKVFGQLRFLDMGCGVGTKSITMLGEICHDCTSTPLPWVIETPDSVREHIIPLQTSRNANTMRN